MNLIGFVDTGEEGNILRSLKEGKENHTLAKEVMQINFQGHSGFRFPVANFPVNTLKASEIYVMINSVIAELYNFGFKVDYVMMDGGQKNRNYMSKIMTNGKQYLSYNVVTGEKIVMCQDFSHNCKKMRNNLLKSFNGNHKRAIIVDGKQVKWEHWQDAAKWDAHTHTRRIHYRLTKEHINPTGPEKQRNALAFDVLD